MSLNLPEGDFAVFGSGPLIIRGLIDVTNDLDVICRGKAWETAMRIGEVEYNDEYEVTLVSILNGQITFGNKWGIGNPDIDELIDTAETLEGLPFIRLEYVIEYKILRSSARDLAHIEIIRSATGSI